MKYDIFISYRRDGGAQYARIIQLMLQQRGYSVFLDYDELTDGKFNEKIKDAVANADIFMLVLSKGALKRCVNEDDWVMKEITLAMELDKQIIPVNPDNTFDELPEGIPQAVKDYVGLHQYSEISFGQTLGITVDYMVEKRIVPHIGNRNLNKHIDNDFDSANASLKRNDERIRLIKKAIIFGGSIIIIAIVLGLIFAIKGIRKNRLDVLRNDIEVKYQTFDLKFNSDITINQLKTIDDIFGNMSVVAPDSLWISQFECRVSDWEGIVNDEYNDSQDFMPMTNVSYGDCQMTFVEKLQELTGLNYDAKYCIDIPTADEWEFAAGGGFDAENTIYAGSDNIDEVAWYRGNSNGKAHPSDGRQGKWCNARDIFDMSGNVAEWTSTPYITESGDVLWTICGGSYDSSEKDVTVSSHIGIDANTKNDKIGFRIIIRKQ